MQRLRLLSFIACLGLCACASPARKTWVAPNRSTELRFVLGPSGTYPAAADSYSYYSLHDHRSGKRLAVVRSIITDDAFRNPFEQTVHFSPTGQTVLIYENIDAASPAYAYTLLYRDRNSSLLGSRALRLPLHYPPPSATSGYAHWPFVVSITDTEVEYQFYGSKTTERKRFDDLRDSEL